MAISTGRHFHYQFSFHQLNFYKKKPLLCPQLCSGRICTHPEIRFPHTLLFLNQHLSHPEFETKSQQEKFFYFNFFQEKQTQMKKKKNIHPRRGRQLELSSRTIIFETQFFFVLELLLFYLSWERAQELQQAVLSTIRDSHWLHNFWSPDICSLRLSFFNSFFYSSYLATRFHLVCLSAQHFCADWLPKIGDSSRGFKY